MITKITPIEELKEIFIETLLDKTDNVTKVADASVLNGVGYGVAKIGQKVLKDIALIESHLFPDSAYGSYLDEVARMRGVAPRFSNAASSTYIRLSGAPGTVYTAGVQTFTGNHGIIFDLDDDVTIPAFGFTYTKIKSQTNGLSVNVDPLTINIVNPIPIGHLYCINEYAATGAYDSEDDDLFRKRIKESINQLARGTLAYLEQILMKLNNNILRIYNRGMNSNGEIVIAIATVNGTNLTTPELDLLFVQAEEYFSLSELRPYGNLNRGVVFTNTSWQPIDFSFRAELDPSADPDVVRKNVQIAFNKELDYRFWTSKKKVEWDNFLQLVKNTEGITYVPDNYFTPNVDIIVDKDKLPRIRGFQMLDLNGAIIVNFAGTLNPVFYPAEADFSYQASILRTIV
jgi:hypothetical protein